MCVEQGDRPSNSTDICGMGIAAGSCAHFKSQISPYSLQNNIHKIDHSLLHNHMKEIHIRLTDKLYEQLTAAAKSQEMTRSGLMRSLFVAYCQCSTEKANEMTEKKKIVKAFEDGKVDWKDLK
tara:strand:+ start:1151 stop:1519 length:369 start_codon:yes stop_codon:yes gene_type:complete